MRTLGEILGLTKQNEVLILTLIGICCTVFDASIFTLHSNLHKVWITRMDPTRFTYTVQIYFKYILSSIVIVRTFTVHLYLAFYIVMLWPAIFVSTLNLMFLDLFCAMLHRSRRSNEDVGKLNTIMQFSILINSVLFASWWGVDFTLRNTL